MNQKDIFEQIKLFVNTNKQLLELLNGDPLIFIANLKTKLKSSRSKKAMLIKATIRKENWDIDWDKLVEYLRNNSKSPDKNQFTRELSRQKTNHYTQKERVAMQLYNFYKYSHRGFVEIVIFNIVSNSNLKTRSDSENTYLRMIETLMDIDLVPEQILKSSINSFIFHHFTGSVTGKNTDDAMRLAYNVGRMLLLCISERINFSDNLVKNLFIKETRIKFDDINCVTQEINNQERKINAF